jgi:hypothetical protein
MFATLDAIRDLLETNLTTTFKKYFVGYVKEVPVNYLPVLMVYAPDAVAGRRTTGTDQWQRNIVIEIITNAFGKVNTAEDTDKVMQAQKQLWDLVEEVDTNNIFKATTILGVLQRNLTGTKFKYHSLEGWEFPTDEITSDKTYIRSRINLRVMSPFVPRS